ncbi:MAG: histidine--tRNA ligase [Lentisphaeraceae bacterium]|nr:histidine--tRNA ligase [Lentisphaeraceae bacterium]
MSTYFGKMMRGFPEWLPSAKRQELEVLKTISSIYESYGYTPIETAAVEKTKSLATTGDVSKEIFGIHRLAGEGGEQRKAEFGLHFDLTLPFARYTAENAGQLQFPFKRYQIQKVWRGERPQQGRYREFYQSDIDIVGDGVLPAHFEAEVVEVVYSIFKKLNVGDFTVRINNRKLLEGYYRDLGIEDMGQTLIALDKIDKEGRERVIEMLLENGLTEEQAEGCVDLAAKKFTISEGLEFVAGLDAKNETLEQAKVELTEIFNNLSHLPDGAVIFDLSIARGLDYYTGSVYECTLKGLEHCGSVCSGGRYDNLAGKFTKRSLPGVGLSIGITRLLYLLFENDRLPLLAPTPTQAVVILFDESQRPAANKVAAELRSAGVNTEVSHQVRKFAKQIQHAEKRGARFIIIPEEDGSCSAKDLQTGEQESLSIEKLVSLLDA